MILYIVRHAWAGEHGDPRYPDDAQRPLTKEGRKRMQRFARILADRGVSPRVIATSPLVRCRQTAEILAANLRGKPKLVDQPSLEPGSKLAELIVWANAQQVESIAWVGHAPDVGRLVGSLISEKPAEVHFAKDRQFRFAAESLYGRQDFHGYARSLDG